MPIRLLVTANAASADGQKPPPQELKLDGEEITIGREKTATVVLGEPSVSRNHAKITREGSLYFLEDVGSAFGTRVNGAVLPKGEKRLLRNGDIIAVGTFDLTFTRLLEMAEQPGDGNERTAAMARAVMKDVMRGLAGGTSPYLLVLNGPHKDDKHEVSEAQELTVGRADDCDIIFSDDLTSRRHAKIRRDWSGTHVEDLGSRNGVKVNKKLIKGPTTLKDRDEVEVGGTRMLYVDPSEIREAPFVPPQTDPGLAESDKVPARVPKRAKPNDATADLKQVADAPAEEPAASEARPGSKGAAKVEAPIEEPPAEEPPPEPEAPEEEPQEDEAPAESGGALGKLRSRLPVPGDADALRRFMPLVIVGGIAIAAIVLLVVLFAT